MYRKYSSLQGGTSVGNKDNPIFKEQSLFDSNVTGIVSYI